MAINSSIFVADTQYLVDEAAGQVVVRVERTGSLAGDVTITYNVTGDTAAAGVDFEGGYGTVVMPDGASGVTIPIRIDDDKLAEPTETFAFSIVNVIGATLWAPRTSRISILDDETPTAPPPAEPPLSSDYVVTPVTVVDGLYQPIRLVPDPLDANKMFVAEKAGVIAIADLKTGQTTTFLDLRSQVNEYGDRGLLSIALHPDFMHNPYVYAFVVIDPPDSAGRTGNAGPDGGGNRYAQVLRFTADAATNFTTVVPGSETVLLGAAGTSLNDISGGGALDYNDPSQVNQIASDRLINAGTTPAPVVVNGIKQDYLKVDSSTHAGGALAFGPDGALYVSVGDGTSYDIVDPRSVDVQSLDSLSGKILRIDPLTGQGLATNPFVTDGLSLDTDRDKIFQYGLRNPFSITFDQEGRLFITDTGWNSWEELNNGGPGANFGWPYYEGSDGGMSRQASGYKDLTSAQDFYAAVANGTVKVMAPFRSFSHDTADPGFQVQAVTGGETVYDGSVYPATLDNDWIFEDFAKGRVYAVNVNDRSQVKYLYTTPSGYAPVDFVQAPNGYVYAADIALGQIERLEISPAPTGGDGSSFTPASISVGSGVHALVLKVSQDFWRVSAQYTIGVDGAQIGGAQIASALHGAGQDDTVTVLGNWGAGNHVVTVNFLNDADGGSEGADRNLYVDGLSFDGEAVTGGSAALLSAGGYDFAFTAPERADQSGALNSLACFAAGTRIRTPKGDVPVERLAVGDLVLTASGGARPIVWLGSRTVKPANHSEPALVTPVRIRAGAFGPGLPVRDLLLSPEHAVFVNGVLIPVEALIDGDGIAPHDMPRVIYWHVELDAHDVIFAEGLPAESFLDTQGRAAFGDNAMILHAVFGASDQSSAVPCARIMRQGPVVEEVRRALRRRASPARAA